MRNSIVLRKGDRFQADTDIEFIVEVVDGGKQMLISNPTNRHDYPVGMINNWDPLHNWKYLGNFSKSSNFDSLYDKLNNECN